MDSWDHEYENLTEIQPEAQRNTFSGDQQIFQQTDNELQQWLDQFSSEETVSKRVFDEKVSQLEQQLEAVRKELEDAQAVIM